MYDQPIHDTRFARYLREDRRLLILRLLSRQGDYCLNDGLLLQGLDHLGHGIGRTQLRRDLVFLQKLTLLDCWTLSDQLQRVCLREMGLEVIQGKCRVVGVRAPTPTEVLQDHRALEETLDGEFDGA